jgi:hypothetical protein
MTQCNCTASAIQPAQFTFPVYLLQQAGKIDNILPTKIKKEMMKDDK